MTLAFETHGSGPHLAFVHGFTQTRASWLPLISTLQDRYTCTTIDAPGHGESRDGKLSLPQCGDHIAEIMHPGTLIGYSMGARMALHTALQHPTVVRRLVLISGTAGIEKIEERTTRVASDELLADRIEEIGIEKFITEWLQNPMCAGLTHDAAQISERLQNTPHGLAESLRYAGTGTQQPLWDQLTNLEMPVLIVAGHNDHKFVDLATRMASLIPRATLSIVQDAGHTVHLEQPELFRVVLEQWLSSTTSGE